MTRDEVVKMYVAGKFEGRLLQKVTYALQMIEQGGAEGAYSGIKDGPCAVGGDFSVLSAWVQ